MMRDITHYFQSPNRSSDSSNILSEDNVSVICESTVESPERVCPHKSSVVNGSITNKDDSENLCQVTPRNEIETVSSKPFRRNRKAYVGKEASTVVQDNRKGLVNTSCGKHETSREQNAFHKIMFTSQILSKAQSANKEFIDTKQDGEGCVAGRKKQSDVKKSFDKPKRKRKPEDEFHKKSLKKKRRVVSIESSDEEFTLLKEIKVRNVEENSNTMFHRANNKKERIKNGRTVCSSELRVLLEKIEHIDNTQGKLPEEKQTTSSHPTSEILVAKDLSQTRAKIGRETDDTSRKDYLYESKKSNNLLSYFNKVANYENIKDHDRIMVTAVVHYPLTTSGNKTKIISRKPKRIRKIEAEDEIQIIETGVEIVKSHMKDIKADKEKNIVSVAVKDDIQCHSQLHNGTPSVRNKISSPTSSCKKWKMRIRLANSSSEESPSPVKEIKKIKSVSNNVKLKLTFKKGKMHTTENVSSHVTADTTLCDEAPIEGKEQQQQDSEISILRERRQCTMQKEVSDGEEDDVEYEPIFEVRRRRVHPRKKSSIEHMVVEQVLEKARESSLKSGKMLGINSSETLHSKAKADGPIKLAPLFVPKRKNGHPDKAFLEARKSFLQSGIPDTLKKIIQIQRVAEEHEFDLFPSVSHIQQKNDNARVWNLPVALLNQSKHEDVCVPAHHSGVTLGILLSEKRKYAEVGKPSRPPQIKAFRNYLHSVKAESPDFPVYRTFKTLRDQSQANQCNKITNKSSGGRQRRRRPCTRKVESNNLQNVERSLVPWTTKYHPSSTTDMVGNANSLRKLKKWLELWIQVKENSKWQKNLKDDDNSGNEFVNDASDEEGKSNPQPKNTVVLLGPSGTGKTLAVYTVARELGYKVLEVNASSRRTGRRILAELLEATQSHQVQGSGEQQTSGIKSFFKENTSKKSQVSSQKDVQTEEDQQSNKLSLILVEDIDVVFEEEDEGFLSALSVLVAGSKRPVVLVTSNESCPHLSRFTEGSIVLKFRPVCAKIMGVWLQLISLLEGVRVTKSAMEELLNYHQGDVRRSLMQLQMWVLSGGNNLPPAATTSGTPEEIDFADDASNSSWISEDDKNCVNQVKHPVHSECLSSFLQEDPYLVPVDLGRLWWNVPGLVGLPLKEGTTSGRPISDLISKKKKDEPKCPDDKVKESGGIETTSGEKRWKSTCSQEDVLAVLQLADTLSAVDLLTPSSCPEPAPCWWEKAPTDSLSLKPDMRPCWSGATATLEALASCMVAAGVNLCSSQLQPGSVPPSAAAYQKFPGREETSWREQRHLCDSVLWNATSYMLWPERRAVATDCLPSLRNISRLEQERSISSSKRANRFFHYLKGVGVHASSSALNTACVAFHASDSSEVDKFLLSEDVL